MANQIIEMSQFNKYLDFIDKRNIISSAYVIILGNMVIKLINKITDEILIPIIRGKIKLSQVSLKEYVFIIINDLIISYLLFLIIDKIEND